MSKTLDDYFRDWEATAFGFGYGSGEPHILPLLHEFMARCSGEQGSYDFRELEPALGPAQAWFLINVLCRQNAVEYGTSPRYGWLTPRGRELRDYVLSKDQVTLTEIVCIPPEDYDACYPEACNCGPNGFQAGIKCQNPFWRDR